MDTKKLMIAAAALLLAAGQLLAQNKKEHVVVLENEKYGYDEATASSINPVASAHTMPVVADLTVSSTRITHKETFGNALTAKDLLDPDHSAEIRYLKSYTLTRAVKLNNADLLLVPVYEIRTSADMNTITVEVTGYPATYTNFRKASANDLQLIKQSFDASASTPNPTKKQTTIINPVEQ
ncbi:MAG: hypothetical protein K5864_00545 [Bacteroidales bacterium]|nr:hypothetical protein [Bacteroidales bacterium]